MMPWLHELTLRRLLQHSKSRRSRLVVSLSSTMNNSSVSSIVGSQNNLLKFADILKCVVPARTIVVKVGERENKNIPCKKEKKSWWPLHCKRFYENLYKLNSTKSHSFYSNWNRIRTHHMHIFDYYSSFSWKAKVDINSYFWAFGTALKWSAKSMDVSTLTTY